jgi:hypothetical protein
MGFPSWIWLAWIRHGIILEKGYIVNRLSIVGAIPARKTPPLPQSE